MNKFLLPAAILLTLFLSAITVVFAVDKKDPIIVERIADISGDRKDDSISITGTNSEGDTSMLRDIRLVVKTSEGKSFQIKLKDGFEPKISLNDFNHDGVKDIFVKVDIDEKGEQVNCFLYSFKGVNKSELNVPETLNVRSQYEDGYIVSVKIDEANAAYIFDFTNFKEDYDQLGLYRNGKLNEPMELVVSSYQSLNPVQLKNGKVGLKGIQKLSGVIDGATVGTLESSWEFNKDSWELVDATIQSTLDLTKE